MNKSNLLATLSLALTVAALSYAALSPVAMAFKQEMIIKGATAGAGQAGQAGQDLTGHGITNYQGKSNAAQNGNADTNQKNDNKHDLARIGADGTNGQNENGADGTNGQNGQNGNGADGTNGQNGLKGSPVESSNGFNGNQDEDFNIEVH